VNEADVAERPVPHAPGRAPRPSRWRTGFYAASVAVLVGALGFAPLPYLRYVPGIPQELSPLIEVSGAETSPIDGETALLTVFLDPVTPLEAVGTLLDPVQDLTPVGDVATDGLTPEFFDAQREQFSRQFQVATAVGAEAAGVDVTLRTSVLLVDVLPDGPAAEVLAPGDEIRAFNGEPLQEAAQLQAFTRASDDGDQVTLTVAHAGGERDVDVTLGRLPGSDQVGLGVLAETVADGLDLPFEVELGDTRIGGPSAGMMTALTVFDLLSDEDLVAGRTVVGTGTITPDGRVGPVGGVPSKVRAAAEYGADVVLVPGAQLEPALAAAPAGLEVHGVATFEEALDALR
jgi:Lon-like protease